MTLKSVQALHMEIGYIPYQQKTSFQIHFGVIGNRLAIKDYYNNWTLLQENLADLLTSNQFRLQWGTLNLEFESFVHRGKHTIDSSDAEYILEWSSTFFQTSPPAKYAFDAVVKCHKRNCWHNKPTA